MTLLKVLGSILIVVGSLIVYMNVKDQEQYNGSEEHFIDVQHGMEMDNDPGFIVGFTIFMIGLLILNGCNIE